MTLATSREDMVRATMEGITFDLKDMLLAMLDANVPTFNTVRITGGIAVSEIWNQMQADIYGWDVETVEVSEATALGCALVAAVGAGIYNSYKDAVEEMVKVVKRYTPNEKTENFTKMHIEYGKVSFRIFISMQIKILQNFRINIEISKLN